VVIEFERQVDYNARGSGNELQRRETTEITCDVDLDHGCSLRLASDEPEGDRVWRILEFSIDYRPFDLREAATSWRSSPGPEPPLPEGALLRHVRHAFAEWVASEGAGRGGREAARPA
jgi:hypothetical protein